MVSRLPHTHEAVEHIDYLNCRKWLVDPPQGFDDWHPNRVYDLLRQSRPELLVVAVHGVPFELISSYDMHSCPTRALGNSQSIRCPGPQFARLDLLGAAMRAQQFSRPE